MERGRRVHKLHSGYVLASSGVQQLLGLRRRQVLRCYRGFCSQHVLGLRRREVLGSSGGEQLLGLRWCLSGLYSAAKLNYPSAPRNFSIQMLPGDRTRRGNYYVRGDKLRWFTSLLSVLGRDVGLFLGG